jgi:hypothetical protein
VQRASNREAVRMVMVVPVAVGLKQRFPVAPCRAAWAGSSVRLYGCTRTNTFRDLISNDGQ